MPTASAATPRPADGRRQEGRGRAAARRKEPAPIARQEWLVLVYRVPREPTRLRAAVWRRLKAAGAVYLQGSVAALPVAGRHERALRALRHEILDMGGTALVLRCDALAGGGDLLDAYNAARDEEYDEIADRCNDFLAEIRNETSAGHFTYAELEENDEDLVKLRGWFDKVASRDVLGARHRAAALDGLQACSGALDGFATEVYNAQDAE